MDSCEEEDSIVFAFLTDAPVFEETVGEVIDFAPFEGGEGDDCDLDGGFLFQVVEECFEAGSFAIGEHLGLIGDVAAGFGLLEESIEGGLAVSGGGEKADREPGDDGWRQRFHGGVDNRLGWVVANKLRRLALLCQGGQAGGLVVN